MQSRLLTFVVFWTFVPFHTHYFYQAVFWIRPSLIPGCTKFGFLEYNPAANFDDGTCYTKITSETCEERHWAYSNLPDGIYNQHPKKGGLEKKSYCDMQNGGWMVSRSSLQQRRNFIIMCS